MRAVSMVVLLYAAQSTYEHTHTHTHTHTDTHIPTQTNTHSHTHTHTHIRTHVHCMLQVVRERIPPCHHSATVKVAWTPSYCTRRSSFCLRSPYQPITITTMTTIIIMALVITIITAITAVASHHQTSFRIQMLRGLLISPVESGGDMLGLDSSRPITNQPYYACGWGRRGVDVKWVQEVVAEIISSSNRGAGLTPESTLAATKGDFIPALSAGLPASFANAAVAKCLLSLTMVYFTEEAAWCSVCFQNICYSQNLWSR
jgi:hypothetical protein